MAFHLIAATLTIAALLVAGPARAAETTLQGDGGTVHLLVNMAGDQSFPSYTMQKLALDQKHGFKLDVIPSPTVQTNTTALQAGTGDIGMFAWNELARIKAGGVPVVGIAPFLGWANTIVVPVNSPIHTVADLKGKSVGVYNRTGLDWAVMRALAQQKYHMDLQKEVVMQEGAVSLLRGLMEQERLDATQMFNDFTAPMVVSGKFRQLMSIKDAVDQLGMPPDTPLLLYTANTNYAAAHPANVRAFLAAYRDSIQALMTDDTLWSERGQELGMTGEPTFAVLRHQTRPMLIPRFAPTAEADIRKLWSIVLATVGAESLGMSELTSGFMTLDYQ